MNNIQQSAITAKDTDKANGNNLAFRQKMLDWYDENRRTLPWRAPEGEQTEPYRVWLSEIMLQQTTVTAVIPYFLKFTRKWPDVQALAQADNEDVMQNWAGLGYYARARNLHKCAKIVSKDFGGVFPDTQKALKSLPGIGEYTSAAILSIAFAKPAVVVDGNVERVIARYHRVETPLPEGKKVLKSLAGLYSQGFTHRTGDYAQSLMDLGAGICTPKSPKCPLCPLHNDCAGYKAGKAEMFPIKAPKKTRPKRYGFVYHIENEKGEVLLHKRRDKGLLGGMYGLPTSEWLEQGGDIAHLTFLEKSTPKKTSHHIEHVFTHFHLKLDLYTAEIKTFNVKVSSDYSWINKEKLNDIGFPSVFKKVVKMIS